MGACTRARTAKRATNIIDIGSIAALSGCSHPVPVNPIAKRSLFAYHAPSRRAEERSNGRS